MSAKRSKTRRAGAGTGKRKGRRGVDVDRPLEVVRMSEAEAKELKAWLRREMTDPTFKAVDPVKLNHAFLQFMAQVHELLKLKPQGVQRFTGVTPQHQRKLRPHVNPQDDVQVALTSSMKWGNGLHLNPAHVLEWLLKHLTTMLMPFHTLAA